MNNYTVSYNSNSVKNRNSEYELSLDFDSSNFITYIVANDSYIKLLSNISQVYMAESIDGITEYPTKPGIYRHTGADISKLPPYLSNYGTLIIFYSGYYLHLYHDDINNTLYFGKGDINGTISWKKIVTS